MRDRHRPDARPWRAAWPVLLVVVAAAAAPAGEVAGGRRRLAGVGDELIDARQCGLCHDEQFHQWSASVHAQHDVQCYECHGGFHSGTLGGCRRCHQAIHRRRFANWPEVTRFDDEGASDYLCAACHNAHAGQLRRDLKKGCYACHGDTARVALSDAVHRDLAGSLTPVHMDVFAREHAGVVPWFKHIPRPLAVALGVAGGLAVYGLCFLGFLPLGYLGSAAWGAVAERRGRGGDGASP